MRQPLTINGESLDDLLGFLAYLKTRKTRTGMVNLEARAPSDLMTPFLRALMRREARLLRQDADSVIAGALEPRTHDQRRADAFVDLISSIASASRYSPGDPEDSLVDT